MATTTRGTFKPAWTPDSGMLTTIRADLNLEKWPIWQPAKSPHKKTRVLRRDLRTTAGTPLTAVVTIGYIDRIGTLTTEDQKTWYGLLKLWEEGGHSVDLTVFSLRQLAATLHKRWGTNVLTTLTRSLTRLRAVPLVLQHAYYDGTTGETYEEINPMTLLADLKIRTHTKDGHVTKAAGYFKFHELILGSLIRHYTKPVLLDPILHFTSEIAQILYQHFDLVLANRPSYERRTHALFVEDMGLNGVAYQQRADRRRKLHTALRELRGVRLTTGVITTARLVETVDGTDDKVVICKGRSPAEGLPDGEASSPVPAGDPTVGADSVPPTSPATSPATALVQYFYRRFHGGAAGALPTKALRQAEALLAEHGEAAARFVVDFAWQQAQTTRYPIEHFGGILPYVPRALAAYEGRHQHAVQQRAAARNEQRRAQYETFWQQEIERLRTTLSPDDLAALEATVRAQLLAAGETPAFALTAMARVQTDALLAERSGIPSFEAWQQAQQETHA